MRKPYLIQRLKYQKTANFSKRNLLDISNSFSFDYMGSAEYEYGAIYNSVSRIMPELDQYAIFKVDDIVDIIGRPLFIICKKSVKDICKEHAINIVKGRFRLKEHIDLTTLFDPDDYYKDKIARDQRYVKNMYNIGWDIENDFLMIFSSKKYAYGILEAFRNTKNKYREKEQDKEMGNENSDH